MSLQYPAREAFSMLRQLADHVFGGAVSDMTFPGGTPADAIPDFSGFCVSLDGSLALVELGTAGFPDWKWSVQVTSGLAIGVPRELSLMQWINEQNRTAALGKYYCPARENGMAVLYETMIWGGYFMPYFSTNQSQEFRTVAAGRLRWEMSHIIETGARQSRVLLDLYGGQRFPLNSTGIAMLFNYSAGDAAIVRPRYDGLYVSSSGGISSYLRFTEDGRVSEASSTGSASEVARWLGPENSDLGQGTYSMNGSTIFFTTITPHGRIFRNGDINKNATEINSEVYSEINGKRSEQVFNFIRVS